jgi:hypothetical protein
VDGVADASSVSVLSLLFEVSLSLPEAIDAAWAAKAATAAAAVTSSFVTT